MSEERKFCKVRIEGWIPFDPIAEKLDIPEVVEELLQGGGTGAALYCLKRLTYEEALVDEEFGREAHDFFYGTDTKYQDAVDESPVFQPHPNYVAAKEEVKKSECGQYTSVCPFCGEDDVHLVSYWASCCAQVLRDGWDESDGRCDTSDEQFKCLSCEKMVPAEFVFVDK